METTWCVLKIAIIKSGNKTVCGYVGDCCSIVMPSYNYGTKSTLFNSYMHYRCIIECNHTSAGLLAFANYHCTPGHTLKHRGVKNSRINCRAVITEQF